MFLHYYMSCYCSVLYSAFSILSQPLLHHPYKANLTVSQCVCLCWINRFDRLGSSRGKQSKFRSNEMMEAVSYHGADVWLTRLMVSSRQAPGMRWAECCFGGSVPTSCIRIHVGNSSYLCSSAFITKLWRKNKHLTGSDGCKVHWALCHLQTCPTNKSTDEKHSDSYRILPYMSIDDFHIDFQCRLLVSRWVLSNNHLSILQ